MRGVGGLRLRKNEEIRQQYLQRQREQQEYMKVSQYFIYNGVLYLFYFFYLFIIIKLSGGVWCGGGGWVGEGGWD